MSAATPDSAAAANARDLSRLVSSVFERWRTEGIAFVVLRNYENLPHETGNDIDVLVAPEQLKQAERALGQTAAAVGYRLHNRAEFSPVSLFFFHAGSHEQIQFDLFTKLVWRGLALISARDVLERRHGRGNFFIPDAADEAVINLLTRLVYQGYVKEKYRPGIAATLATDSARVCARLEHTFGAKLAERVVAAATAGDWTEVERLGGALRWQLMVRQICFSPVRTLAAWGHDFWRLTKRLFRLPGITVVLVGADGCGKSTVAEKMVVALRGTFHENKSLRVHWKPAVFLRKRRQERPPSTDPHGQPPRGAFPSVLLLVYHWTEFLAGYWLQLRPVLFRNGLVLVDRYHYDFVVDPRRFRLAACPGLARFLFGLLPAPDLIFVLDAPAEVLQTRKREVPLAETARQREAYRREVGPRPNARVVDVTQPADKVAAEVVGHTLAYMATREQRRRGNDPAPAPLMSSSSPKA